MFLVVCPVMVPICSPWFLRTPLATILSSMLPSVVVIITIAVSVVPVGVRWIVITMPGQRSLVLRSIPILILLTGVWIKVRSRQREMSIVMGIRMAPVPVPLSEVRRWIELVPFLLRVAGVSLSVFCSVGMTA